VLAAALAGARAEGNAEAAWLVGPAAVATAAASPPRSAAFASGGVYVLRSGDDHVFIDCGPVGLAGRGGHGHNDCLSFEATLAGTKVIVDSGSYVYTASAEWRNRFRSTAAHNTPMVDGEEQNRIPHSLWQLADDAVPEVELAEQHRFRGAHSGYRRLAQPVRPVRTIALDPERHTLVVHDAFGGEGEHDVEVPLHVAPGFDVSTDGSSVGPFRLYRRGDWRCSTEESWVSPSYGVRVRSTKIVFRRSGLLAELFVVLAPTAVPEPELWDWAEAALR
jgi:hypothetical protein